MAKQAWLSDKEAQFITEFDEGYISCTYLKDLTAFAKLVAEHERNEIIEILDASTGYVHMDAIRERT